MTEQTTKGKKQVFLVPYFTTIAFRRLFFVDHTAPRLEKNRKKKTGRRQSSTAIPSSSSAL
jgi:hypothetical protein